MLALVFFVFTTASRDARVEPDPLFAPSTFARAEEPARPARAGTDDKKKPAPVDPAAAEAAKRAQLAAVIDKAFANSDPAERAKAIESAAPLLDALLVTKIARGLGDRDALVQRAAIEALRYSKLPEAGRALRDAARTEPALRKDPEMHAALLRAVAQNGAPEALGILTDEMWAVSDARVLQARFLGFGRVRTRASLETLIGVLRTTSASKIEPYMEHVRTSLMVLTSVDQGTSIEAWLRWWNESGSRATIAEKPAPLPKQLQIAWETFWGEARGEPRATKRSDRGRDDPEGPPRK